MIDRRRIHHALGMIGVTNGRSFCGDVLIPKVLDAHKSTLYRIFNESNKKVGFNDLCAPKTD